MAARLWLSPRQLLRIRRRPDDFGVLKCSPVLPVSVAPKAIQTQNSDFFDSIDPKQASRGFCTDWQTDE